MTIFGRLPISLGLALVLVFQPAASGHDKDQTGKPVGVQGPVGCRDNPKGSLVILK